VHSGIRLGREVCVSAGDGFIVELLSIWWPCIGGCLSIQAVGDPSRGRILAHVLNDNLTVDPVGVVLVCDAAAVLVEPLDRDLGRRQLARLEVDSLVLASVVSVRLGSYVADVVAASAAVLRVEKTIAVCSSAILSK
jgi:hypothetical protein